MAKKRFNPLDRGNSNQMTSRKSRSAALPSSVSIPQIGEILIKFKEKNMRKSQRALLGFNPLDRGNSNQINGGYLFSGEYSFYVSIPQIGEILIKFYNITASEKYLKVSIPQIGEILIKCMPKTCFLSDFNLVSIPQIGEILIKFALCAQEKWRAISTAVSIPQIGGILIKYGYCEL